MIRYTLKSLVHILGLGSSENTEVPRERYQDPTIEQTQGKMPRYYIRPYVDVIVTGRLDRRKKRIFLQESGERIGKREAESRKTKIMATINRAEYMVKAQIPFGEFLTVYMERHVEKPGQLAAPTQAKYRNLISKHIRPQFEKLAMCEVDTRLIDHWLADLSKTHSWGTRLTLKNVMSSIFTKAADWGYWQDRNPVERVDIGRQRDAREKVKLTDEQQRALLAILPEDVRMIIEAGLFFGLRISEIFGLQEKHLDFERGLVLIRQRYYRGDVDVLKSARSRREIPMGQMAAWLKATCTGDPERWVFTVRTHKGKGTGRTEEGLECRCDRSIQQHFLRPAAKALGIYTLGFGFHAFRREAITSMMRDDVGQAMRMAGHSSAHMSLLYTLSDLPAQEKIIRQRQSDILGSPENPLAIH